MNDKIRNGENDKIRNDMNDKIRNAMNDNIRNDENEKIQNNGTGMDKELMFSKQARKHDVFEAAPRKHDWTRRVPLGGCNNNGS